MGSPLTPASLAEVRATIANAVCGRGDLPEGVGSVTLVAAQRECVRRARASISRFGGVLIATDVGSGKTYVALTLARAYTNPVVLAPAALRTMWASAMTRANMTIPFISLESLGHGRAPPLGHDVVVVDEAHHLRNKLTRTHQSVRSATAGAKVVLLSATPVHNRAADLETLLKLFLKGDARDVDEEARAQMIVRSADAVSGPPVVVHAKVAVPDSSAVIARIRALPPPIAVRDGGVAVALMRLSLLRAWCSSVGAFTAMLRRALLRAAALADALREGRHPTRAELKSFSDDGQLAFTSLMTTGHAGDASALTTIDAHVDALSALRTLVRAHSPLDDERARRLAAIVERYQGVPVLACAQYASTVEAYWTRLRLRRGVAALTSRGARIASGPIGRDDALARFAPVAQGERTPHDRERIHLLIATDLVSEGVNLHDAGVIVHLDVPWTAARLAQRVGRIARMGSPHPLVHTYELAPPHGAAQVLALTSRLKKKRRIAARLVGGDRRVSELLGDEGAPAESAAEARARIVRALGPFAVRAPPRADAVMCGVSANVSGWLALVADPQATSHCRLVARTSTAAPTTDPRGVAPAAELIAATVECRLDSELARATVLEVDRWLAGQRARDLAGVGRRHAARAHGSALAATIGEVTAAPAHERVKAATAATPRVTAYAERPRSESLLALVVFCPDGISARRPAL